MFSRDLALCLWSPRTCLGRPCGSFGDISTMSFYPNKHITTGFVAETIFNCTPGVFNPSCFSCCLDPFFALLKVCFVLPPPFQAFVSVLLFKLFWMIRSVADYCIACRFLLVKCFCFHSSYLQENIYWHHARWRWDGSVRWPWSGWKVPCFVAR